MSVHFDLCIEGKDFVPLTNDDLVHRILRSYITKKKEGNLSVDHLVKTVEEETEIHFKARYGMLTYKFVLCVFNRYDDGTIHAGFFYTGTTKYQLEFEYFPIDALLSGLIMINQ